MKSQLAILGLLIALNTKAQQRDTVDTKHHRFNFGIGIADPYLAREDLYTSDLDFGNGRPIEGGALWRNAFHHRGSLVAWVRTFQLGYQPKDDFEIALGGWSQRMGAPPYKTSFERAYGVILVSPNRWSSPKLRPAIGACIAWDRRWHELYSPYSNTVTFKSTIEYVSFAAVAGMRFDFGSFTLGCDLNLLLAARIGGDYFRLDATEVRGDFEHWIGPLGSFRDAYAFGPMTFRLSYTIKA
ncbi:MAG: hypothetical protein IPL52_05255 [Flavobacteriales bacterium]|nr:hypothetical protein [Flavobacteriales bacterium]